jgi:hypothetical protein
MLAKVPSEPNNTPNTMDKVIPFHDIKVWANKLNSSFQKVFMLKSHILVAIMSV